MTEAYNDALQEQAKKNVWENLTEEAKNLPDVEKATLVADVAGIFDPTPTCDAIGGILSASQGDWLGAGLSVLGMIPYVGDLGKVAKIGKRAPKTAKVLEQIFKRGDDLASAGKQTLEKAFKLSEVAAARKKALARVQQAMLDARNKVPGREDCAKLVDAKGSKKVLQMPRGGKKSGGKWDTPDGLAPKSGDGVFRFKPPKQLPDGRTVTEINFKKGAPDFDDYVVGGKQELWVVTGDATKDARALKKQMREIDPNWNPPPKSDYVLHHFEDGSVGYVPRELHDRALGGASHTGGNSMINNELY